MRFMYNQQNKLLHRTFSFLFLGYFLGSGTVLAGMTPQWQSAQTLNQQSPAQLAFNQGMERYREGTVTGFREAIKQWEEALELWRKAGDQNQEAVTLNFLCSVYANLGQYQEGINCYNQLLSLNKTLQDQHTEASSLVAIAKIYTKLGEYQQALDTLNQSLGLWNKVNFKSGEVATLNEIAFVYFNLGDLKQSLNYYNQALELVRTLGNSANMAAVLNNLGQVQSDLKEFEKALYSYNQAKILWDELIEKFGTNVTPDIQRGRGATLNNIGFVYASSQKLQPALDTYNQALELWQTIGDRTGEASTLNNIGFVYFQQGNLEQALDYYQKALQIRREVGDRPKEALSRYRIAMVEREKGNFEEAIRQIEAALGIIEDLRTKVTNQDLRASFLASKQDYYQFYIDLLMQLHKQRPDQGFDGKALQISERAKARSLLDLLNEAQADITSGIDPMLLRKKLQLKQELEVAEERRIQLLSNPSYTDIQKTEINQEIEILLQDYRKVLDEIRVNSPRYAALTQPQPLNLEQIQQLLDQDTVLLEYALGEERSYLWAVTPNSIQSYELPNRKTIEAAVKNFRDSFLSPTQRIRRSLSEEAAKTLKEMVLPLSEQWHNKRLLIVADGVLQYVPFPALPHAHTSSDETLIPLVSNHELITLPSASTLGILRREIQGRIPAQKLLAVLADPVFSPSDERLKAVVSQAIKAIPAELERSAREAGVLFERLPYTQEEAKQILALVPAGESLQQMGFDANRSSATNPNLSQYRFLHFATHGLLNSQTPQLSGLVLSLVDETGKSVNGFLRLYDIFNLNLPAELVVLSACETGLGKDIKGEGLVGLTRGFMYAGASRVVVSLWSVDDEATSILMVKFYQGILNEGLSPAAALRQAQMELQQNPDWSSPYYWAGFTLQGEWEGIKN